MKSLERFILISLLGFFFFGMFIGCDTPKQPKSHIFPTQSNDTLDLAVGFSYESKHFDFKGKTYICLYDLITFRKVKIYDEEMNWIKSFSLEPFVDPSYSLDDLEMITLDSLLLITDYQTNVLISINTKTHKVNTIALNSVFTFPEIEPSIEFLSSKLSGFRINNQLIFKVTPSITSLTVLNPSLGKLELLQKLDSLNKLLPAYVMVEKPFVESPKLGEIPYSKAFKELFGDAYYFGMTNSFFGNGKIISPSRYQDYIDVYDLKTKKAKKISISSEFTDISVPLRKWEDLKKRPEMVTDDSFNNDLNDAGQIFRIFYDEKKKQYHFLLWYSKERSPKKVSSASPFIWQIYDKNFVLLSEREHDQTDLAISLAIATKKYIYFGYYNKKTYDPYQAVLVPFAF